MGLFDFFKKEKEIKDLTVKNLDKGCILSYDLKTWEVDDVTDYDWGNNRFTHEYTIKNGVESVYLHLTEESELKLDVSADVKLSALGSTFKRTIIDTDSPLNQIVFEGEEYVLTDEFMGTCTSRGEDDWSEFVNWIFHNKDETKYVSVNRWGETDMNAVQGKYVKEFEFSDFLSSPDN